MDSKSLFSFTLIHSMKKSCFYLTQTIFLILFVFTNNAFSQQKQHCLQIAYPEVIKKVTTTEVHFFDGTILPLRHHTKLSKDYSNYEEFLDNASLMNQLEQCYPLSEQYLPLPKNYDPGRARYEPFFKKMYGSSAAEVRKKLVSIRWMPSVVNKSLMVTTVNGVDKKLLAISKELETLPKEFHKYLQNPGGTFLWRTIAGTKRLSTHSFGCTIDINVAHSDYWRWFSPNKNGLYEYKNRIPYEIVRIFEKHGFIWGGKWYHFDTMHFEYRPELFQKDCHC